MRKTIYTREYDVFVKHLIHLRDKRGLNQRTFAKRLKRSQSLVAKVEMGERRLDVIEFIAWCHTLRTHPAKVFAAIYKRIQQD